MIYRVLYDGVDIHTNSIPDVLINPTVETEMNTAGSFSFTLPPDHFAWGDICVFKGNVDVYENNELIFFGRVANVDQNWNNERVVECEGALAFFNDSIQRPNSWTGNTLISQFLSDILDNHNAQVPDSRKIYLGNVTIDDMYVTRETNYEKTLDVLTRMCIDTNGGYFSLRKDEDDGKIYLDWLKDLTDIAAQPVEFGLNLLDISKSLHAEDIVTGVLARGAEVNDVKIDLHEVGEIDDPSSPVIHHTNLDPDILWHREGLENFGRVVQVKEFNDCETVDGDNGLLAKATEWLVKQNTDVDTIEVDAAELGYFGESYPIFLLGQKVTVNSTPHGLSNVELPMYKISMNLDSGTKRISIGTPPKRELTQISASNMGGGSGSGSSSGGGSGSSGVQDVRVNGTSVVQDGIARVNIPTDTVTESEMNTAISTAVTGKANQSDLESLATTVAGKANQSDLNALSVIVAGKANTSEVNAALALKADKTDITEIEANPSEAATSDLTKLKVGSDIYGIPSGGSTYTAGDYININNDVINVKQNKGDDVYSYKFITTSTSDYGPRVKIQRYINGVFQSEEIYNNDNVRVNPVTLDGLITFTYGNGGYYWQYTVLENSNQHNKNEVIKWYYTTVVDYEESFNIPQQDTSKNLVLKEELEEAIEEAQFNNLTMISDYYSEDEQVVGRWTDGKPLYQKVIDCGYGPNSSSKEVDLTALNIDNCIQIGGYMCNSSTNFLPLPRVSDRYIADQLAFNYNNSTKMLIITCRDRDMTSMRIMAILKYTKTTDAPGTGPTKGNLIYLPTLYSEEEREVGVWTDGKPVYQKTISVTIPNASSGVVCNVNANVDYMINLHYHGLNDTDFYNANSSYTSAQFWYRKSDDTIQAANILDWMRGDTGYLTVQYTKTTDQPGSGTWTPEGQLAHHYSTSEKIVGTWIDGSTVYERTWDFGTEQTFNPNTWTDTTISALEMSKIISVEATNSGGTNFDVSASCDMSYVRINHWRSGATVGITYLTLRYTKST